MLEKLKLLQPLVWNERTGNLVSGHQRIGIIDQLEGTDDYQLDFSVVNLSEADEMAANIAFNNEAAMGQFDADGLQKMLEEMAGGASLEDLLPSTGFDLADLAIILPDSQFFAEAENRDGKSGVLEAVEQQNADAAKSTSAAKGRDLPNKPDRRRSAEGIKDVRAEATDAAQTADDTETYAVLMFGTREAREDFMELIGLQRDERYADGADVVKMLGA